ncbi:hypothetical protein AWU68_1455 [Corynebacterium simulans]|nr:hypothetical protein AWU68_1455 [Corynebacterium simulans]
MIASKSLLVTCMVISFSSVVIQSICNTVRSSANSSGRT